MCEEHGGSDKQGGAPFRQCNVCARALCVGGHHSDNLEQHLHRGTK